MTGLEHLFIDHGGAPASRGTRFARGTLVLAGWMLLAWVCWIETAKAWRHSTWTQAPCTIISSVVESEPLPELREGGERRDRPYSFHVRYEYRAGERTLVGQNAHSHDI